MDAAGQATTRQLAHVLAAGPLPQAKAIADFPSAAAAQVRKAIARADRVCLVEAGSPTWIGYRLRACRLRISKTYGLRILAAKWPTWPVCNRPP